MVPLLEVTPNSPSRRVRTAARRSRYLTDDRSATSRFNPQDEHCADVGCTIAHRLKTQASAPRSDFAYPLTVVRNLQLEHFLIHAQAYRDAPGIGVLDGIRYSFLGNSIKMATGVSFPSLCPFLL